VQVVSSGGGETRGGGGEPVEVVVGVVDGLGGVGAGGWLTPPLKTHGSGGRD
jgi:hypothetical protein